MLKAIKRLILSTLSVLLLSVIIWTALLLNPKFSYAHETHFDMVTVYHNQELEESTEQIIKDAITILEKAEIIEPTMNFQLCMNDGSNYPNLHLLAGQPLAYAIFNKTVIKNCTVSFEENLAKAQWEINDNEYRTFNLTSLLAHEFTHNLQYNSRLGYVARTTLGKLNWKLEGHAEYISKEYKGDGRLKNKIEKLQSELTKSHIGIPVFTLDDGTKQSLSYFKTSLTIQYMMEKLDLTFDQICDDPRELNEVYDEMMNWYRSDVPIE